MELVFNGYRPPSYKTYLWKVEIPWQFKQEIEEELIKVYGKDVKYSLPVYAEIEVFLNEDNTNLTIEQTLKLHDPNPPKSVLEVDLF